jgi:hypothetical protein
MAEPETYRTIKSDDAESIMAAQLSILDMVKAKIEQGNVASLAVLIVGPDRAESERSYDGARYLVHPTHLDVIEKLYRQMMDYLVKQYGVTPEQLRADRERVVKR